MEQRQTLTWPVTDGDNVGLLAWGVEGVRDSRKRGAKVQGDDKAFVRRFGDGCCHRACRVPSRCRRGRMKNGGNANDLKRPRRGRLQSQAPEVGKPKQSDLEFSISKGVSTLDGKVGLCFSGKGKGAAQLPLAR